MKKLYSNKWHILVFLLPALLLFCGVLIAPIGASAYFSLFDWNGFGEKIYIGFSNYKELFTSDVLPPARAQSGISKKPRQIALPWFFLEDHKGVQARIMRISCNESPQKRINPMQNERRRGRGRRNLPALCADGL